MPVSSSDKALLAAAAAVLLGSAGVFGYLSYRKMMAPAGPPPQVELASAAYEPVATEPAPVKVEQWAAPMAQSRGREWIYDTFTPPEIFYNTRSKQFTVKPPSGLLDDEALLAFGLELVAVQPEPFRLQLIGYVGEGERLKGMFQNTVTGEVLLLQGSERVPALGLTINDFQVRAQPIAVPESMTTQQRVAFAVIRDEKNNREVTLTNRERVFTGTVFAFVAAPGQTETRTVRTGDTFKIGEASYTIEKIQTTPPTVEVVKEAPGLTQPDRRVLTPREVEMAEEPDAPPAGADNNS